MPDWNTKLREARERLGLSRVALAERSWISAESLRSYELGRRRPTREHLSHLLTCMKMDVPSRNFLLANAGFAPETPVDRFPEPNIPLKEAVQMVRRRPWPTFLLNQRAEVLALSGPAGPLVGVSDEGLKLLGRRRSILTATTRRAIVSQSENWDQLVVGIIASFKGGVPEEPSLDEPGPYLAAVLKQICAGDPALVVRFTKLWETTPPFRGRMTGLVYPTVWRTAVGTIRFSCLISCLNTEVGLYAHTWIPADSRAHLLLEKLLAEPLKTPKRQPSPRTRRRTAKTR